MIKRTPRTASRRALCVAPRLVRKANKLVRLMKGKRLTIATAESCTGGLISAALSQADGASDVLEGGFVAYTKDQKARALGVPQTLLKRKSAVTADVACRMAKGALRHSRASVAIAVTGVLGPEPDEDGNPVGLIYFACARKGKPPRILRKRFAALSHDQLRSLTVLTALDLIDESIRKT